MPNGSHWRSSALVAVLGILIITSYTRAQSAIYLSARGATVWDGSCPSTNCLVNSPCAVPDTLLSVNAPSLSCMIHFNSGNYSTPLSLQAALPNTTIDLVLGNSDNSVFALALSLTAGDVSLSGAFSNSYVNLSKQANSQVRTLTVTPSAMPPSSAGARCTGSLAMSLYGFDCIGGEWHKYGDWVISQQVRFLNGSSPIFIHGDVSFLSNGSLYFTGPRSGVAISGCITTPKNSIVLDYSDGWLDQDGWSKRSSPLRRYAPLLEPTSHSSSSTPTSASKRKSSPLCTSQTDFKFTSRRATSAATVSSLASSSASLASCWWLQ